ncbi:hypothetical protein Tco_0808494, partial [Tanacetum coccineum]
MKTQQTNVQHLNTSISSKHQKSNTNHIPIPGLKNVNFLPLIYKIIETHLAILIGVCGHGFGVGKAVKGEGKQQVLITAGDKKNEKERKQVIINCHDYPSRGYNVISCVNYIPHLLSVSLVSYSLTKWYQSQATINKGRRREVKDRQYDGYDFSFSRDLWKTHRGNVALNTVEDRIMDSGASFHATYCKEELERFKLRSGNVRLADDKTLDIAGIEDVVLKTSFSTSWTLKDVRWFGEAEESFLHNVSEDKETAKQELRVRRELQSILALCFACCPLKVITALEILSFFSSQWVKGGLPACHEA